MILSPKLSIISRNCFAENLLTTLTVPEGVEGIDIDGFRKNRLAQVSLPSSLKWLGDGAFFENPLVCITLGAAGTYRYNENAGGMELQRFKFSSNFIKPRLKL